MAGCTAMAIAPLPGDGSGTLLATDRQEIYDATGVSAAVRFRDSWGMRMLTLAGPPDNLTEARRMAMSRIAASQNRQAESQELADAKKSGWGRPSSRSAPYSTKSPAWWAVLTRCTGMQSAQCRLLPRRRTATAATAAAPAETAATAPARLRTEGEGAPREAEAVSPAQALRIALVNRQTTKRKEVRRCKSCHSLRSAVQRLQKSHGALVEDFSQVPGNKVEAFYKAHGHLRGEDLRLALQEVVTDWKQSTTELSFTGTGEFLDLQSLEKKYEDRPAQLDSIKEKTYKFWDHIRGCYLYEDVKYTRTAQAKVVTGTSRKRKGQVNLLGEDDPPEEPAAGSAASKKKPKKGEKGVGEDLPTIKTQQLKKLSAAAESINAKRLTCLDLIDRARNDYVDMIPGYVVTAANTCVSDACKLVRKMESIVLAKKGHAEDLMQEAKDMMAAMNDNLNRIKGQVDQAASFRDQAASS